MAARCFALARAPKQRRPTASGVPISGWTSTANSTNTTIDNRGGSVSESRGAVTTGTVNFTTTVTKHTDQGYSMDSGQGGGLQPNSSGNVFGDWGAIPNLIGEPLIQ